MESQNDTLLIQKKAENMEKGEQIQMRHIKNKEQDGRFKFNHINN